jgi:uncharacterized tellurite resistance protein B-like protein
MSKFKHLTFLKVLSIIAWADGEVTHAELNLLKSFYRKFGLDRHDIHELTPYLEAPVSAKHRDELFRQLIDELALPVERKEIVQALEAIQGTKKRVSEEEKELARKFTAWLQKASPTRRSLGRVRNFITRTLFSDSRDMDPDLEKYFKRRVLDKIRRKSARRGHKVDLPEEEMYHLCLLGALLASVAHEGDGLDEQERGKLEAILSERFAYTGKTLALLLDVVEEQVRQGFDFHEVMTQVNQTLTYNERRALLDCFFAMAVADGEISHQESEEIRRITKAMHIPHQEFKAAKIAALEKIR